MWVTVLLNVQFAFTPEQINLNCTLAYVTAHHTNWDSTGELEPERRVDEIGDTTMKYSEAQKKKNREIKSNFFLLRILGVSWCPADRLPARRRVSLVVGLPP